MISMSGSLAQFEAVEDSLTTPTVYYSQVKNQQAPTVGIAKPAWVANAALIANGVEIVWTFPAGAVTTTAFTTEYGSALEVDTISWVATRSPGR